MISPIITELSNLDKFFFYFFLPALVVFVVGGQRFYFRSKKPTAAIFRLSEELIFGNIVAAFVGSLIAIFLYLYILELDRLEHLKWEFLTLVGFVFLSIPIGIGIGTHVVAVSVRKLLDTQAKNAQEMARAIQYFHYPFSHNLMFSSALLLGYLLALLDFFRGRNLELNNLQIGLLVLSGVTIGAGAGILFIITKCHRLILRTTLILSASVFVLSLGESRTLIYHPIAFLFTVWCVTITLGILLYKQTRVNLRGPVKRMVKKWLQWDIDYL